MPSTTYTKPHTDHRTCKYCGTRLIFARTPDGKKLPAVEYGEDPLGTVAVQHTATGAWIGRFLAKDEQPIVPEKRHAVHHCDGLERRRQRRRGRGRHHPATRPKLPAPTPTLY